MMIFVKQTNYTVKRLVSLAGLEVILMDLDNVQDIEILRAICKKYMVKMKKGLCIQ